MPCDLEKHSDSEDERYGPVPPSATKTTNQEPQKKVIGPALPPSFKKEENVSEVANEDFFGPALPPHLLKRKQETEAEENNKKSETRKEETDDDDDDDDDDMIGPVPADSASASSSYAQQKLEERAWRLKTEYLKKEAPVEKKREEWMTDLPPATSVANLGLGPRKFRTREGPDMSDRSCWSDTPADRERKRKEMLNKESYEKPRKSKKKDKERSKDRSRDRSKEEEKSKKKKEKSLLEMHQEKMKEKRKKEEKEAKDAGRTLRRPFDRDIDLRVGGLSEKDKKSIFAKSQLLNDRFCHGTMEN